MKNKYGNQVFTDSPDKEVQMPAVYRRSGRANFYICLFLFLKNWNNVHRLKKISVAADG